ncbi:MAG TPA: pyruvate synthase subunit beta, partial [Firmicutes bacterium]|nr:pyruvate synthase subunit beta [Bacillota bacterium]
MKDLFHGLPERLYSGHTACPGCGAALAMRQVFRMLDTGPVLVIAASCWSVIAGVPPFTSLDFPVVHSPLPCAAALGSGLKRGLVRRGNEETEVVVLAGDGGTFDIGLQSLSGAAYRNENIIFICYDNEAYMNTGVHSSSATPYGSRTSTLPPPRFHQRRKKDIMQVIAGHNIPYAATATIAFPKDLAQKIQEVQRVSGFRFLHLLTPCPTGWGYEPRYTVELSRLAVESCLFPLYEIREGQRYNINYRPSSQTGLETFLQLQQRFTGISS